METKQATNTMTQAERLEACASTLRRHGFDVTVVRDEKEAFERMMRDVVEPRCRNRCRSGDSMTMRATGIIEWLRKQRPALDAARRIRRLDARPERLEIRRKALLSDLFITGINAVTMEGTLHWLDMVGNRIAPSPSDPARWCSSPEATRSSQTAKRPKSVSDGLPPRRTSPATKVSGHRAPRPASAWTATPRTASATRGWRCCGAIGKAHTYRTYRQGIGIVKEMKRRVFPMLAALLLAACGESTVVFYTVHYPVVLVEAEVTLDGGSGSERTTEPPPTTGHHPTMKPLRMTERKGAARTPRTKQGQRAMARRIHLYRRSGRRSSQRLPVQAGGGYTLYFSAIQRRPGPHRPQFRVGTRHGSVRERAHRNQFRGDLRR